jgi:hypothetical protein
MRVVEIMSTRIGPKMLLAVKYVHACGGSAPNREVCHYVNPCPVPSKNEGLGYDIVHRARAAGLVSYKRPKGATGGTLRITRRGMRLVDPAAAEQAEIDSAAVHAYPFVYSAS